MVINKPAGLVVHSDGRTEEPTVVDWILAHRPEIKGVGEQIQDSRQNAAGGQARFRIHDSRLGNKIKDSVSIPKSRFLNHDSPATLRSGIVHRLDRETSGVLLIAKNQKAFWRFKKQFQKNLVRKVYHAFVYGRVKNDEGVIDRPIARSRSNPVLWSATRGRKGKEREAVTEYRVLARFILPYQGEHLPSAARRGVYDPRTDTDFTFLELRPRTGRTHQIRVHLKAINYPIVCDKLYAPKKDCLPAARLRVARGQAPNAAQAGALGFNRLALHSRSLAFALQSGKEIKIEAPYPNDFKQALDKFT